MCKVLENRSHADEERINQLTNQLKDARLLAEDSDNKSDDVMWIINIIWRARISLKAGFWLFKIFRRLEN